MRGSDRVEIAGLLDVPVREFVRQTGVRLVLLVAGNGQVLAQYGFVRVFDAVNVAALAAATHASAGVLAEMCSVGRWHHMHHAGREQQIFLAPIQTPSLEIILVAMFDGDSSLGLVQLFAGQLAERVAAMNAFAVAQPAADAASFERELESGLDQLFAPRRPGQH